MAGNVYPFKIAGRIDMHTGGAMRGIRQVQGRLNRLFQFTRSLRAGFLGMDRMMMGAGASMIALGLAARGTVRSMYDYSDANARIGSILASVGADMRNQNQLMEVSEVQARRFGHSMSDAGQAMGTLLETGVSTHEAMRYFPTAARFARAAGVDLNDSTRVLVDSMRQFNMQSEEGANFLAGAFTVAGRMSSTSIHELQQAFRYASVEMAGLGYSAQETISALAGMSAIGLRSTTAGTRLRRMLVQLINPTKTTINRFATLRRISPEQSFDDLTEIMYDADGSMRPLADTTMRLATMFQEFGNQAEQNEAAVRLFGVRGLAAGVMFSRLHARGGDWLRVLNELNDRQGVQNRLNAASEAGMQGFARQVDLLKIGLTDFGRIFGTMLIGNMEDTREGFGTYISQLAVAVRGADMASNSTGQLADEYRALSPEMKEQGKELRETLKGLAELLKILGKIGLWLGKTAADFPTLTASIVMFGAVIAPVFGGAVGMISKFAVALKWPLAGLGHLVKGMGSFAASAAMVVQIGGVLSLGLTRLTTKWDGSSDAVKKLDDSLGALKYTAYIPIFGPWILQLSRLVKLAWDAIHAFDTWNDRQESDVAASRTGAADVVRERGRRLRLGAGARYGTQEVAQRAALDMEMRTTLRDMIIAQREAIGQRRNVEAETSAVQELLQARGLEETEIQRITEAYSQAAERITRSSESEVYQFNRLGKNSRTVADRLAGLSAVLQDINSGEFNDAVTGESVSIAPVQDAYVRSTGWVPASAGDILVDSTSLANVMATRAGGILAGGGAQQVAATPEAQRPQNQSLELTLEIPVTIDGREVARAIGHHTLQINQRRGTAMTAGTRRRVAETGVG